MPTLEEVGKTGAGIGIIVFAAMIAFLIMSADSFQTAGERLGRFTYALAMTIAPTTPIAIGIDFIAAIVGVVSASRLKDSIILAIVAFVATYTFLALSINYLAAPV